MQASDAGQGARLPGEHRGTRAIQRMVEHAPAGGGLALWMRHEHIEPDARLAPVVNDGTTIRYQPSFETLPLAQQAGWVAHATLHVALRHAQRRAALARLLGDVDDELFNACADAIVNSTLGHLAWLELPRGAITLEAVLTQALELDTSVEAALLEWDVERLYRAIDDRRPASAESSGERSTRQRGAAAAGAGRGESQASGGQGQRDGDSRDAAASTGTPDEQRGDAGGGRGTPSDDAVSSGGSDGDEGATLASATQACAERADGPRAARVRALLANGHRDLLPPATQEHPEQATAAAREWAQRLSRAHAGDGGFSLLRTLLADTPRSRVPWELVLRTQLVRGLARTPSLSWSRPSRSWLANRGRTPGGRRLPWEPGIVSSRAVPVLALILDVSGSIDEALLARLTTQLDAISRRTEAEFVRVVGDDQVRYVDRRPIGDCRLDELEIEGGGGTDFRPLLTEAARHRPDLAVVLTDLDGPAGEVPAFPVLWVVTPPHAHARVPFGRLLVVDDS